MAKDTYKLPAKADNPEGMNDNAPSEQLPSWYETNGVHSHSQHFVERKTGSLLINKFPNPILGIHGDLKDRIFIETTGVLYMLIGITSSIPAIVLGDDGGFVLGDDELVITE